MSEQQQAEMKELKEKIIKLLNGQSYDFCDNLFEELRLEIRDKSIVKGDN